DERVITGVLQVLKDRAGILPHQYGVRRVVMNAQLVPHSMLFADLVQGDPGTWSIGNVVVVVVSSRPSGHRTLLNSVSQLSRSCLFQQRNKALFKIDEVLIHGQSLISSHKSTYGVGFQ